MVCGIGVDTTDIRTVEQLVNRDSHAFETRTFSKSELQYARLSANYVEYLAVRFAIKEAVYKAIANLTKNNFDFRRIESLSNKDGSPYIVVNDLLKEIMDETALKDFFISATTENHYATAFVIVQK